MSRSLVASSAWPSTTCVSARRKKSRSLPAIAALIKTRIGGRHEHHRHNQASANHRRLRRRTNPALFHAGTRESLVRGIYLYLLPRDRPCFLDALSLLAGDNGRWRTDRAILASDHWPVLHRLAVLDFCRVATGYGDRQRRSRLGRSHSVLYSK